MNLCSSILWKDDNSLQKNKSDLQKNKSEKYNKILSSAGAVFAEYGFYKATISQIATKAGVADGTLYLYFKNKDDILYQLQGGLRSSMGYIGAKKIDEIQKKTRFIKITKAGFYESMVHSVEMIKEATNYKL